MFVRFTVHQVYAELRFMAKDEATTHLFSHAAHVSVGIKDSTAIDVDHSVATRAPFCGVWRFVFLKIARPMFWDPRSKRDSIQGLKTYGTLVQYTVHRVEEKNVNESVMTHHCLACHKDSTPAWRGQACHPNRLV